MTMTKPTSEQVTFTAAGSGATLRNLVDKVREVVSVKDFGAVGDGVSDDTAAVQAAMSAANGKTLRFADGDAYRITAALTMPSMCDLDLGTSTLVMVGSARLASTALTPKATTTVTAGATASSISVTVASAANINVGDYFSIQVNTLVDPLAPYEYPTVFGRIVGVSGTTITLDQALPLAYAGTVNFYVYSSLYDYCIVRNGTLDLSASTVSIGVIRPNDYVMSRIERVRMTGSTISLGTAIFCFRGLHSVIKECRFENGTLTGQVYQIQDINAARIEACSIDGGGFGLAIVRACDAQIVNNTMTGRHAQEIAASVGPYSVRGIKPIGNATVSIIGNYVNNYDTGVKYENSFRHTTVGNSIFNSYSAALNQGSPPADTTIAGYDIISSNIIETTGLVSTPAPAILVTAGPNMVIVTGNILRNIRQAGIYTSVGRAIIQNNSITDWNLASGSDSNGGPWGAIHFFGFGPAISVVQGNTFSHSSDLTKNCITFYGTTQNVTFLDNVSFTANPMYQSGGIIDRYSSTIDKAADAVVYGYNTNSTTYPGRNGANHIFNGSVTGTVRGSSATSAFVNVLGGIGTYSQPNGTTSSFTCTSSKLFTIALGSGKAAMAYADFASSTIAILSDPSSVLENSSTPTAGKFGAYKSGNSHVISLVNNTGGAALVSINILGANASVTTDPV